MSIAQSGAAGLRQGIVPGRSATEPSCPQWLRPYRAGALGLALFLIASLILTGDAVASPGQIQLVGGGYRGNDCLSSPSPDPGQADIAFTGEDARSVTLGYHLNGIATTPSGATYLSDPDHRGRIQQIQAGSIRTVAGGGSDPADGPALGVQMNPRAVAVSPASGQPYFVDTMSGHAQIRTVQNDAVVTVSDLPSIGLGLNNEFALAVDGQNPPNLYLAAESGVRRIASDGTVGPVMPGVSGQAVAVDPQSSTLFAVDRGNFGQQNGALHRVDLLTGNASALRSDLAEPYGVAFASGDNRLFVSEGGRGLVVELNPATGAQLQAVAGTGQAATTGTSTDGVAGTTAQLAASVRLAVDAQSPPNIGILDSDNCVVRMVERMPVVPPPLSSELTTPPSTGAPVKDTVPSNVPVTPTGGTGGNPVPDPTPAQQVVADPGSQVGAAPTPSGAATPSGAETALPSSATNAGGVPSAAPVAPSQAAAAQPTPALSAPPTPSPAAPAVPGIELSSGQVAVSGVATPSGQGVVAGAASTGAAPSAEVEPEERGAPHFAMVAKESRGLTPFATVAAGSIVVLFACVVGMAALAEGVERRSPAAWARPRI